MRTVVLVDDEPGVVDGLSLLIDWAAHGYRIVGTACDGAEALSLIEQKRPDLVITDIRMPEMDGLELIRAACSTYPTHFVIASGYRDFEYARSAISLGVEEYLLKPIYEENLCATLASISEKLGAAGPAEPPGDLQTVLSGGTPMPPLLRKLVSAPFVLVAGRIDDLGFLRGQEPGAAKDAGDRLRRAVSRILQAEHESGYVEEAAGGVVSLLDAAVVRRSFGTPVRYIERLRSYTEVAGPPRASASFVGTTELSGRDDARLWLRRIPRLIELLRIAGPAATEEAEALYARGAFDEADRLPAGSRLMHAVADGDMAYIADCLDAAEEIALSTPIEPTLVTDFAGKICFELHRTVTELGGRPASIAELARLCRSEFGDACVRSLFAAMKRAAEATARHLASAAGDRPSPRMERIREDIATSFTEDITIRDLADRHGISAAYLGQLFRNEFGESFKDYRTRLRVEEAARYLRSTDLRVYQIARKVGYSSIDYFERRFLEYFGTTPTSYRIRASEP